MVHIIGHRGGRDLWAENGMTGFRELAAMPVEGVEFDVHLTGAGELLVIHDPTLDRTTDRSGPVAALAAGEHRSVALKNGNGDSIPTLDEVLETYRPTGIELHVELKADAAGDPYRGLEAKAAAAIDRHGLAHRAILTSFNPKVLEAVRTVAPHIRTLSSFDTKSAQRLGLLDGIAMLLAVSDIIAVEKGLLLGQWDAITALIPEDRLGVWVPNEDADLAFWLNKPLRQLTTDRPDRALKMRRAQ
jgi:glycerophosphoryl diester phosphodiesterase